MNIQPIWLTKSRSTNSDLQAYYSRNAPEFTVLATYEQTEGRGQGDNIWFSEPYKNLTFSLLLYPNFIKAHEVFNLNIIVCLAITNFLINKCNLSPQIKWPNDIFIGEKKLGGVLIENSIRGDSIHGSVIGIGLNVNQSEFGMFSHATSIVNENNTQFSIEDLLEELLLEIKNYYDKYKAEGLKNMLPEYEKRMLGFAVYRNFEIYKARVRGKVMGVDNFGRLLLEVDGIVSPWQHKMAKYILN